MEATQEYLTTAQVARLLRVDTSTVRRWIRLGILAAEVTHYGKKHSYWIAKEDVDAIHASKQE